MSTWAVVAVAIHLTATVAVAAEAPRMEAEELKRRLGETDLVVVDVRAATDWLLSGEKIAGAVRENPKDFDAWQGKYPPEKTIVLYCA